MPYEEQDSNPMTGMSTSQKPEIQIVLDEMRCSNEELHKVIGQLTARLNPVLKEETDEKEAGGKPPLITKLAEQFDAETQGIKMATKKLRGIIARLEI